MSSVRRWTGSPTSRSGSSATERCVTHGCRARRDLVDRTERARELAQEADRLKFALGEIDTVDPKPGEDEALVADIRRLSELDALREAASAPRRLALSGDADDPMDSGAGAATDGDRPGDDRPAGHRRHGAAGLGDPTRRRA